MVLVKTETTRNGAGPVELEWATNAPAPLPANSRLTGPVEVRDIVWTGVQAHDPFSLTYSEFEQIPHEDALALQREVFRLCRNRIRAAFSQGAKEIVLCRGEVVFETDTLGELRADLVRSLARERNRACYVFSAGDPVEESGWTEAGSRPGDVYPTIPVRLGNEAAGDSDFIREGAPIAADFDTGNPLLKVFPTAAMIPTSLAPFSPFEMRMGWHLDTAYQYAVKRARIGVELAGGAVRSMVADVRFVEDWEHSVWRRSSRNRTGFVGRDLPRDLSVRVELNPAQRSTRLTDARA